MGNEMDGGMEDQMMEQMYKPEDDPNSIIHSLPQEPTLDDTNSLQHNLDLILKARNLAIEMDGDIREQEWELKNNDDGVDLYSLPQISE